MCIAGPLSSVSVLHFLLSHWQFWTGFLKLSLSDGGDFLTAVVTTASEMWRAKELPKMLCLCVCLTTWEQCGLCFPIILHLSQWQSLPFFFSFTRPSASLIQLWHGCQGRLYGSKTNNYNSGSSTYPGGGWEPDQGGEFAGWSSVAERDEEVLGCCSQWVSTCPFHHLFWGDHKFFFSKSVKNILPSIGDQMSDEGSKILN